MIIISNLVGLHFKRDYEETLDPHVVYTADGRLSQYTKDWLNEHGCPWNKHEPRSGLYIQLYDGKRIPVEVRRD